MIDQFKIKSERFCALATSKKWHEWLKQYNKELYDEFFHKLNHASGCVQNKEIMQWILSELESKNGAINELYSFLEQHYPAMLDKPIEITKEVVPFTNDIVMTYPRRKIFRGDGALIAAEAFCRDKYKFNHVIVNGVVYVEYLTVDDKHLVDKLPKNKWRTYTYRQI